MLNVCLCQVVTQRQPGLARACHHDVRGFRVVPPSFSVIGAPRGHGKMPNATLGGLRSLAVPRLRLGVPGYEIMLLGRFMVRVDGQPAPASAWRHKRAAELVKVLALADAQRLHSEQVMDLLWPGLAPDAAAGNLRKAVHFARASLGSAAAIGRSGEMLELCPGGQVFVDALAFEAAARSGQIGALDLYRGELLPEDRYASWAEEPRERLRALYLRLLKAAGRWEQVLEVDPADEEAHRALMQRAVDAGDRRAAVQQFERLREHLRADLGVGPDRTSVALYERAISMATLSSRICRLCGQVLAYEIQQGRWRPARSAESHPKPFHPGDGRHGVKIPAGAGGPRLGSLPLYGQGRRCRADE
jgi:DNA-binding SARP family transcriptional activator